MSGAVTPEMKLNALMRFGSLTGGHSQIMFLLGFLSGRVDWTHFVNEPWRHETWIYLSVRRLPQIHRAPFQAQVGGVDITDPVQVVSALAGRIEDMYVQLDFEGAHEAQWYQEIVSQGTDPESPAASIEDRLEELRVRVDETLDIYGECRKALEADLGDRERQIRFFLQRAENEMQGLSAEMSRLRTILGQSRRQT